MAKFLLIDFGTTSTKTVIFDINTGNFSNPLTYTALKNCATRAGYHELDMYEVTKRFEEICLKNYSIHPFLGIIICSEMHGFCVLDSKNKPLTNYISWKDERSAEKQNKNESVFIDFCNFWKNDFKKITGMKPRPGFMPMSLLHISSTIKFPSTIRIVDLPGWLSISTGNPTGYIHRTMLAGLGVYDITREQIAEDIVSWLSQKIGVDIKLDMPTEKITVSGYWNNVPIYLGVGDHQCSLLGAGVIDNSSLSINIGTGAQVSTVNPTIFPEESEIRPFFFDFHLRTITHIPGGRALSTYVNFLQQSAAPDNDIWLDLSSITADDIGKSNLVFELGIFPGSRGYTDGGSIRYIKEGEFHTANYLGSLLRSFAEQYMKIIQYFGPDTAKKKLIFSGGIARRLPSFVEFIQERTNYLVVGATDLDESLIGLRLIALLATGRAKDLKAARQYFRQAATMIEY